MANSKKKNWTKTAIRHPGSLIKFGYHLDESPQKRHAALRKAVKAYGASEVRLKLSALIGFNEHTQFHGIPRSDLNYVNKVAGGSARKDKNIVYEGDI
ncbi:MAG: hypothetical protein M1138_06395 [Candidatus Thermoplasmatota archaeon]|nr:hypothetical protein [Candidatus Thermoplasmatota archaeon]